MRSLRLLYYILSIIVLVGLGRLYVRAQSPPLDFSLTAAGPNHVVVGHSLTFQVTGTILAGVDENVTPTTSGLPADVAVTFPNMIKVCCTDHLWSIGGNDPIRLDVGLTAPPGTYPMVVTFTSVSGVVRSLTYPVVIEPVPSPYKLSVFPPNVALAGLSQYESNMVTYGKLHCTPTELTSYEGHPYYYDGTNVYSQIADYTHDPATWLPCSRALDNFYAHYILSVPNGVQPWRVFPHGLVTTYLRDHNQYDLDALSNLLAHTPGNYSNVSYVIDWLMSREVAYGAMTHMQSARVGVPLSPIFPDVIDIIFGHFDQWFQNKTASFVQPFMVAISSQTLIQYEADSHDPRVVRILQLAANELWTNSWDAKTQSFLYYSNGGTSASPYDPQCSNGVTTPCKGPSPDLNLLILPLYGWVYQHTGLVWYRDRGDEIFKSGVAGAYLQAGKQFSQNYRWSMLYLLWRLRPITSLDLHCDLLTAGDYHCIVK